MTLQSNSTTKSNLTSSVETAASQAGLVVVSASEGSDFHGQPTAVFQLGLPGSLASQYVVVKFGGVVVKGANYAHYQVLVDR